MVIHHVFFSHVYKIQRTMPIHSMTFVQKLSETLHDLYYRLNNLHKNYSTVRIASYALGRIFMVFIIPPAHFYVKSGDNLPLNGNKTNAFRLTVKIKFKFKMKPISLESYWTTQTILGTRSYYMRHGCVYIRLGSIRKHVLLSWLRNKSIG